MKASLGIKSKDRKQDKIDSGEKPVISGRGKIGHGYANRLPLFMSRQENFQKVMPDNRREGGISVEKETDAGNRQRTRQMEQGAIDPSRAFLDTESSMQRAKDGGGPLPESVRSFFESRLEMDLNSIRVHSDDHAAVAARNLNARAFTVQNDIFFGKDQFSPQTQQGRKLIAHELAHVRQIQTKMGGAGLNIAFRKLWEDGQCIADEPQEDQCMDPCSIVDKQAFAGYLIEARNKLEAADLGFNRMVGWTKITREMAEALSGKGLQTFDELQALSYSLIHKNKRVYDIPYCFYRVRGKAQQKWVPICDYEKNEVRLVQVAGTPAEAVEEIFANLFSWQADCAEYLQIARWYALLRTLGPDCFNARIKRLSSLKLPFLPGILELKSHSSTGIVGEKLYIRASPQDSYFYLDDKLAGQTIQTQESEFSLLADAPIGTRVTWTNLAAPQSSSFRNENTLLVGDDRYMSHPWGTGSQQYIECRLAAHTLPQEFVNRPGFSWMPRDAAVTVLRNRFIQECKSGQIRPEMHKHIANNIFIKWIEYFEF